MSDETKCRLCGLAAARVDWDERDRIGISHRDCRPVVAAALLAEREKVKRLADILGQMSTSCVPPLHNCGTCMRARAALAEAGEEGK